MRRVTDAILAADYMTAMAEATPEALLQAMQLGGGMMNLPPPETADIVPLGSANGLQSFRVTFRAGAQSLSATIGWAVVDDSWKITSITDVDFPS